MIWLNKLKGIFTVFNLFAAAAGLCFIALILAILPVRKFIILGGVFDVELASNIGEYIGGLAGAVISLAGIFFLIQSTYYQRRELKANRKALRVQFKELKATRKINSEQQFGSIFFQLLGAYNELTKSFETIDSMNGLVSGKRCLKILYESFKGNCGYNNSQVELIDEYKKFEMENQLILKQFNQSLEVVLTLILDYELEHELKKKYAAFICAQLSYHEEFFLLIYLAAYPQKRFSKEKLRNLEMFDFEPEPPFGFLSNYNSTL